MGKPNEVKSQFAEALKQALFRHFGEFPSNSAIAREFNLRAYGSEPITQESVRRWLKGISMPDEQKLRILVSWLDLDLKICFQTVANNSTEDQHNGSGDQGLLQNHLNGGSRQWSPRGDQARFLKLFDLLPQSDKHLIEQLVKKLSMKSQSQL